jgi:hypothetical protein
MGLQPVSFFLTMPRAIKNEPMMYSLPGRCRRIPHLIGYIEKGALVCAVRLYQMGSPRTFTLMMITPPCQVGSRGWRLSSESVVCAQKKDFRHSVKASGARTALLIVAAGAYFFVNQISIHKSLTSRNSSHPAGTFVTSTRNIIVN